MNTNLKGTLLGRSTWLQWVVIFICPCLICVFSKELKLITQIGVVLFSNSPLGNVESHY